MSLECNGHRLTNSVLVQGREKKKLLFSVPLALLKRFCPASSLGLEPLGFLGNWERKERGKDSTGHLTKL